MNVNAYAVEAFLRISNNVNAKNIFLISIKTSCRICRLQQISVGNSGEKIAIEISKPEVSKKTFIIDCINLILPQKLLTNHIIFEQLQAWFLLLNW